MKKNRPLRQQEPAHTSIMSEDVHNITRNYIVSSSDSQHKRAVIFMPK